MVPQNAFILGVDNALVGDFKDFLKVLNDNGVFFYISAF